MPVTHNIIYSFPLCLTPLCICSSLWRSLLVSHRQTINCLAPLKKKQEKSKQSNSFVNSLLLLAADLAQVVMPILLERTQTSYCHPSLAEAPWTQMCVHVFPSECVWMHMHVCFPVRLCTLDCLFIFVYMWVYSRSMCGFLQGRLCHHWCARLVALPLYLSAHTYTCTYTHVYIVFQLWHFWTISHLHYWSMRMKLTVLGWRMA